VKSVLDHNGIERCLGNLEPPVGLRATWTVYGDTRQTPLFSRSIWPELIAAMNSGLDHPDLPYVHDQGQVGQCNADATAAAAEFCRAAQGLPFVKLSAADLYGRINHGGDNGSLLEDGLAEMTAHGIGTAATAGLLWRPGGPRATDLERALYRALEAFLCPTFEHCMSAVLAGFALISGVLWYGHYTPGANGWLPRPAGSPVGGHAVMGYKPVMDGSRFGIAHQNSWTAQWGHGGRAVFGEEMYTRAVGGWWAIRQMTTERGELPPLET
jgi:hypothetical protein